MLLGLTKSESSTIFTSHLSAVPVYSQTRAQRDWPNAFLRVHLTGMEANEWWQANGNSIFTLDSLTRIERLSVLSVIRA